MRYQISSYELLKEMLAALQDDPTKPWDAYPCLEWPRCRDSYGYGQIRAGIKVHRVAFEIANGPISSTVHALHRCDNPPCFRPIHLFPGDNLLNIQDCTDKLRKRRGSLSPASKLIEADIPRIISLRESGQSLKQIAAQFPVTPENISAICLRKNWRHVVLS